MKVSYASKLLREYIIWPQIKILDFDLIVTNIQDQRSQSWPQKTQEIPKSPSLAQQSQDWNISTDSDTINSFWISLQTFQECLLKVSERNLKLLDSCCVPVSLFAASLDSARLCLVTCGFLLFSGVNFETSGLLFLGGNYLNSVAHWTSFVSWEENFFPATDIKESEMLDLSLS